MLKAGSKAGQIPNKSWFVLSHDLSGHPDAQVDLFWENTELSYFIQFLINFPFGKAYLYQTFYVGMVHNTCIVCLETVFVQLKLELAFTVRHVMNLDYHVTCWEIMMATTYFSATAQQKLAVTRDYISQPRLSKLWQWRAYLKAKEFARNACLNINWNKNLTLFQLLSHSHDWWSRGQCFFLIQIVKHIDLSRSTFDKLCSYW